MKIITIPNPILKQISTPIGTVDQLLIDFISDMEKTLVNKQNPRGVGLSAPQVAKNLRIFTTLLDTGKGDPLPETYINPEIVRASPSLTLGPDPNKPILEGCLSIPDIWGPVWRHSWIKLTYYVIDGISNAPGSQTPGSVTGSYQLIERQKRFSSFPARVIQHELDHLDGILFTDRAIKDNLPLYQDKHGKLEPILDIQNLILS